MLVFVIFWWNGYYWIYILNCKDFGFGQSVWYKGFTSPFEGMFLVSVIFAFKNWKSSWHQMICHYIGRGNILTIILPTLIIDAIIIFYNFILEFHCMIKDNRKERDNQLYWNVMLFWCYVCLHVFGIGSLLWRQTSIFQQLI